MTAPHLVLQRCGHIIRREIAQLLCDDQLERQMKQKVAQLGLDFRHLSRREGMIQLEDFFDQVRSKCLPGLSSIPRAPTSKVPHHIHRASQRRFVLHVPPAPNIIPPACP
jgi:hypothetical protein